MMTANRASILIVEDELVTAENIKMRLEEVGYSILDIADTAENAVLIAKASRPDLVLMDIMLKGNTNGISAAREILTFLDVPVIFLTAYTDETNFSHARETAPYGFISKPYDDRDLCQSIEIALFKHSMDRKLRASELRYRTLVENIPHLICRFNCELNLTFVNDRFCLYAGRVISELLGSGFLEYIPGKSREYISGTIRSLTMDNPHVSYEHEVTMPDDSIRWLRWTNTAIFNIDGKLEEYQSIGEDITEVRLLEQQVIRATDEERRRISRELHDNLGQRISYLGFAVEMHKNELARRGFGNMQDVDEMIRLVRESVDQTRLIAKGLQPVALDPGGFVEAVREYVAEVKRLFNVLVQFNVSGGIVINDRFVVEHLFYIVREAICNAAKHGSSGSQINIDMSGFDDGIRISISNRVGEKQRAAGSTKGMGLDIMRHRADLIGAVLRVDDQNESFTIEIFVETKQWS